MAPKVTARMGPMSGDTSIEATTVTLLLVTSPTAAIMPPTTCRLWEAMRSNRD